MKTVVQFTGVHEAHLMEINTPAKVYLDQSQSDTPGHFTLMIGAEQVDIYIGRVWLVEQKEEAAVIWYPTANKFMLEE